jgi:branched-chain amino acid transport system permease protein
MNEPTAISREGAPVRSDFTVRVATRNHYILAGVAVLVLIFAIAFPFWAGIPLTRRMVDFFIYLSLAQFWNLLLGYAGIISIGQQGFIGIGSYSLWLFADVLHINPFVGVFLAAFAGAIIALPTAALVFKLRGGYLGIGTWVIAEVLRLIVANIKKTGGGSGITIQAATKLGTSVRVPGTYFWALGATIIAIGATYFLLRSRTGLALEAIRDNDLAAESSGVNLWRTRLYVFIIAGAGSAIAGAITAIHLLRVQPAAAFSVNWTAYLVFIVIIGGLGTIEGPIIGTIIYFVLRETTSKYGEWYFIVLGMLAILVVVWSPRGIYGYVVRRWNAFLFPLQRRVKFVGDVTRRRKGIVEGSEGVRS